ncbi:MAG TPA: hypothetical protein VGI19_02485 [Candidatus Cybelea sp.]|jgi:hypothetical protein
MNGIPVSGEVARRMLRTLVVAAVAVAALGLSLPNLVEWSAPIAPGDFDFITSANVVLYAGPQAEKAGMSPGNRIDYFLMPQSERYGEAEDGLRQPPAGKSVSFIVDRDGHRHVVRLAAESDAGAPDWSISPLLLRFTTQKAIFLVLVLLASGLMLVRPTRLTTAFFLFAAGNGVAPVMYSFLPNWGYAVVMVVDDVLAGLGAIGFLALAFYLDPRRQNRERLLIAASALLLLVIVAPIATSDLSELTAGMRPAWPVAGWASFLAVWFCYAAGCALLLRVSATATAARSLRILAAVLAVVGALTIVDWTLSAQIGTWYFSNLPAVAMNRGVIADREPLLPLWFYNGTLFSVRLLGALVAFYVIVRAGIADAGPAYRRIAASIIVTPLAITVLAFANVALMPYLAHYGILVAIEIFAAIAFGYWFSGLRDVGGCLSLACVDSWNAWANGRAHAEPEVLAQSLGLAERTRRRAIIAEVRAQIAFSSWRNGEDGAFEQKVEALQQVLGGRNLRGIRAFANAATTGGDSVRLHHEDLPEWKARAALVLCARTNDSGRAQQLAMDALASADRAGLPSLQVLASIAVAETCADRRNSSLERAHAIARDAGWSALSKSILALRANARDIGILQSFVDVRLRKSRPAQPMFKVSFFDGELRVGGMHASLSEKQLELLLTVAVARTGINDNDLLDALWPESEGDAARNSLRVCLHGLRKNAGDARIVTRVGKGLVLHQWADVDLWRLQAVLAGGRDGGRRDAADELRELCRAIRSGEGRRATLGGWFFPFEQLLTRKLGEAERILAPDAVRRAT